METIPINLHGRIYNWPKFDLGWFEYMVEKGHLARTQNGYKWTGYNFRCHVINAKKLKYLCEDRWFLYHLTKLRIKLGLF